ncbi:MAG: ABC transporter permease [Oscillospiraceae bacterium]|nr:ABC transporter permease [Oscillospiraceae bacterium]
MNDKKLKKKKSRFAETWRRLKKNKIAVVSLFIIFLIILAAILAPILAPYPYDLQDYSAAFSRSSKEHPLGTDRLGRDVLSRLLYGARQSLQIGLFSTTFAAAIGILVGAIAGFYGGWTDNLIMRILDVYQGIPMFLLTVTLAAVLGPSLRNAIIAIAISSISGYARLMRASILTVREMEYVEAATAINVRSARIIRKHIIPNAISPLIVSITMSLGSSVLAGAGLSFIGLGVQPPIPEWGAMISDARNFLRGQMYLSMYPGLCVMITVLSFNLLGDGLRDALDPRQKT